MQFPTTQWSLLARASLNGETRAREALEELCRRYWAPLHQFIYARGYSEAEAQDLTQEFLVHVMEHSTLRQADRGKGRFRSFLLGALVHFLCDQKDRRNAQKRGGGAFHADVTEHLELLAAPVSSEALLFDREWALVILEQGLKRLESEWAAKGGAERFSVLRRFLPGASEIPSYDEAYRESGLSLPSFKTELHRFRQRFKELIRHEVALTTSAPHEVEDEMKHLQNVLMDKGHQFPAAKKPCAEDS